MIPSLDDLSLFLVVAEQGSLVGAAHRLGVPKSTVSRRLAMLEAGLRTSLFHRTTRSLSLTDEGRRIRSLAAPALAAATEAARAIADRDRTVSGRVTITATAAFAQHLVAPRLAALCETWPELQVELRVSEERIDIVGTGVDVALRMGALDDSSLVARRLRGVRRVLAASPRYLAAMGTPRKPDDLAAHRMIVTSPGLDVLNLDGGWRGKVRWSIASGNMLISRQLAVAGSGIAFLPDFLVADELRDGRLLPLLDAHAGGEAEVWLVTSPQRYRSLAVQTVIAALVA